MRYRVTQQSGMLLLSLLLVLITACGGPQPAPAPTPTVQIPVLHPPLQGVYESCSPSKGVICLDRLRQIADAGFKLVINYDQLNGTASQELAYAKQANTLGIQIIWSMSDPAFWNGTDLLSYYPDLSPTCGCTDNIGFILYAIDLVKNLPATWGYYVGDEVKKQDHTRMKAFADLVKRFDPTHPRLFVSGEDASTLGANLAPFVDTAEVIGADVYPVGNSSETIETVGKVAHAVQAIANRSHRKTMMVLQAFSWAEYPDKTFVCSPFPECARFPAEDEMQHMRDLAVNGARVQFILWYSFFDILKSTQPSSNLAALVRAASSNPQP